MFAKILNGIINHYRGDTLTTPICIYDGNGLEKTPYTLQGNDKLYFCIMEPHQAFEDAIVKKVYTSESEKDSNGNTILYLKSTDTEFLLPGTYYYMVKLDHNDGESITTLVKAIFNILGNIPIV